MSDVSKVPVDDHGAVVLITDVLALLITQVEEIAERLADVEVVVKRLKERAV
jgi:hypothetical protein